MNIGIYLENVSTCSYYKKITQFLNVLKSKDGFQGELTLDQYSVQSRYKDVTKLPRIADTSVYQ